MGREKGAFYILALADRLGEEYKIVLVGLSEGQLASLPANVLGLPRTDTPEKLAQIYTAADVFVNPSREETFGLTVAEAMACGTWPIVYADTACAEVVKKGAGTIVTGDLAEIEKVIRECRKKGISGEMEEAVTFFSKQRFGQEVLAVYEEKR